ncbi:MAG: phosphonopyruvate decarboxylase [Rhodospirillaceae bacterium]|nr:phosphonopyruvate decarboxylase [Rhodospirillaceae bacterium]HAA91696.1 phosphonopyruvate decarboxylase [Rhodospirillaceae bacterium]
MARKKKAWQDQLYDLLKKDIGVTQFSYVPDAGHRILIDRSLGDPDVHSIPLSTEEEGVAMAAGAWLGGEKSVVLVQSSGVGNCVNFFSLNINARIPLLMLVSMRGDFGEANPWQVPMGQAVQPVCEACGLKVLRCDYPDEVNDTVQAASAMAFRSLQPMAVLFTQKLLGAKFFA